MRMDGSWVAQWREGIDENGWILGGTVERRDG